MADRADIGQPERLRTDGDGHGTTSRLCPATQRDAARTELLAKVVELQSRLDHALRAEAYALDELTTLRSTRGVRVARLLAGTRGAGEWLRLPAALWKILRTPAATPDVAAAASAATPGENLPLPDAVAAAAALPAPGARTAGRLRIAAILDEFTAAGLAPDCDLLLIDPADPSGQLAAFRPDLLLVESAWSGNGGRWRDRLVPASPELYDALAWCGRENVPTVFWNKEDPNHHGFFLALTRHFDHVYTSAAECVPAYRAALEHDAVGVLPFACQPRLHHPVESVPREPGATFAGSYYPDYPQRARDFDRLVDQLTPLMPVVIFDRNHGADDGEFDFPERFHALIRGRLPATAVMDACKRHPFGINMNSVTDSPTMFARRVFELLACNTVVLSNESSGMRRLFGDLVLVDGPDFVEQVASLLADPVRYRKFRLAGLRKVMSEHTWKHRLDLLAAEVLHREPSPPADVLVVARPRTQDEVARVLQARASQSLSRARLLLVAEPGLHGTVDDSRVGWMTPAEASALRPDQAFAGSLLAAFSPDDHYGPNYLLDLALGFTYVDAGAVGKTARHAWDDGVRLLDDGRQYGPGTFAARAAMFRASALALPLAEWLDTMSEPRWTGIALDEFNYCRDGSGQDCIARVDDPALDAGLALEAFRNPARASGAAVADR